MSVCIIGNAVLVNTGKLKDKISNALTASYWIPGQPQPAWYPNFREDFHDDYFKQFEAETKKEIRNRQTNQFQKIIWEAKFGWDNHAFDTYVYNLCALELAAEGFCRAVLGLPTLNWTACWDLARTGEFWEPGT
jgi:phage terminase large subunit GpA-like protein